MKDILHDIVSHKLDELQQMRAPKPSLGEALLNSPTGIIAEFKRRSPSKGWIKADGRPDVIPLAYQQAGAAAISILTDKDYFGGHDRYITEARQSGVCLPILYKNFVIDELQVYEAALCGASAVLLIAACLSLEKCQLLANLAHSLGLEVLLEIHDVSELEYTTLNVDCIGVNNRHLGTFQTDVAVSVHLAPLLPRDRVLVSESGISSPSVIHDLRALGFRGFLIGETFMRQSDPGQALSAFITDLRP